MKPLSNESEIVMRHKNPVGIFMRPFVFAVIGWGVWYHELLLILIGISVEILLWVIVPPVRNTTTLIQSAIDLELRWLNAPLTFRKLVSLVFFGIALVLVVSGRWLHVLEIVGMGFIFLVSFALLMRNIASSNGKA